MMWREIISQSSFPRRRESSLVQGVLDTRLRGYDGSHGKPVSYC
jgi:hypothetical protein